MFWTQVYDHELMNILKPALDYGRSWICKYGELKFYKSQSSNT